MAMEIVKYSKLYFIFSGILIAGSIASLVVFGLVPGIDFTGGSILEVNYQSERPSVQEIKEKLSFFGLGEISVQPTQEKGVILRMKDITEETHKAILEKLGEVQELRFESVGPIIGKELKQKTKIVVTLSLLAMVLYITLAFRQVSRQVRSWRYGVIALIMLSHDILLTLGVFSVLGKVYNIQVTIPVVVALLTVVGYAINNVVVVFDRIRENILMRAAISFDDTVNIAINQTLVRQINTSLTTLFPLLFIFFGGGDDLKYFALALILGIVFGTYSSIFLAGTLLAAWQRK
jgi:preprotein translocase subunit SecF